MFSKTMFVGAALSALSFTGLAQSVDNEVFIKQLDGAQQANVQQGGDVGFAKDNLADVLQEKGSGNDVGIRQGTSSSTAEDNTATLTQTGDDNDARIRQGDGGTAEDNTATLNQTGDDNDAFIIQGSNFGTTEDNTATLTQTGDDNDAGILQGNFGSTAEDNTATLTQTGDNNGAFISQGSNFGTAEDNTATLTQTGDDNDADIFQGSGTVVVRTSADDPILITFNPAATTAVRSEATISQHGDDHYAVGIQAGTNDFIDIQQSGQGSFVRVAQGVALP